MQVGRFHEMERNFAVNLIHYVETQVMSSLVTIWKCWGINPARVRTALKADVTGLIHIFCLKRAIFNKNCSKFLPTYNANPINVTAYAVGFIKTGPPLLYATLLAGNVWLCSRKHRENAGKP